MNNSNRIDNERKPGEQVEDSQGHMGPRLNFYENNEMSDFLKYQSRVISRGNRGFKDTIIYEGLSFLEPRSFHDAKHLTDKSGQGRDSMSRRGVKTEIEESMFAECFIEENERSNTSKIERRVRKSIVSEEGLLRLHRKSISVQTKGKHDQVENPTAAPPSFTVESSRGVIEGLKFEPESISKEEARPRSSFRNSFIRSSSTKKRSNIFVEPISKKRKLASKILKSWVWRVVVTLLIFYALFSDDLKLILFRPDASVYFDIMIFVSMMIFTLEIVISLFADKEYFLSFYFFLDIISTLTMLLDLSVVSKNFTGPYGSLNNLFRSAKTAKIGARAGRITRVIRVVGVLRLSKIFKEAEKVRQNKVEKFDKNLKVKREEREKEAKKIKEQFSDLESLR